MEPEKDADLKPIRHVQQFDELSSGLISQPTIELEKRLKILENSILSIAKKGTVSNIVLQDKSVSSSVQLYNTVYYNKASGLYEPTLAKVEFTGNSFKTMRSGLVQGIVIKLVGTVADILVDGVWPREALTSSNSFLETGESYIPGIPYYLSTREYGRVTARVPTLAIQVFIGTEDSVVMNKVYNSPGGFETSARFEMGMRPVGDIYTVGNQSNLIGFHALEKETSDPYWTHTDQNVSYDTSGYLVADGWSLGYIKDPIWLDITVKQATGHIEVRTSEDLSQLGSVTPEIYDSTVEVDTQPFALILDISGISDTNHHKIRTLYVKNEEGEAVYKVKFRFAVEEQTIFDLDKDRKIVLKIPHSFMGWKELDPELGLLDPFIDKPLYQIQPYYDAAEDSDYADYSHNPSVYTDFYYNTKADLGFVQNWPPEPMEKTIVMMNGVELPVSKLVELGASSKFETDFPELGASIKSLYWGSKFGSTLPWDVTYNRLRNEVDGNVNPSAQIPHAPSAAGAHWHWTEDLYDFEPYNNKGWVYSNKLSVYYRSTKVLGVGVLPPFKIQDTLTGLEPSYDGEPITGNLLIWKDSDDSVVQKTSDIQLGSLGGSYNIYSNSTKFNVLLREIIFVVKRQNSAEKTNEEIGVSYDTTDSAVINLGTGVLSSAANNIVSKAKTNVYEWNTYAVMTLSEGAVLVPPSGTVNLGVVENFPVDQLVSVIVLGRVV